MEIGNPADDRVEGPEGGSKKTQRLSPSRHRFNSARIRDGDDRGTRTRLMGTRTTKRHPISARDAICTPKSASTSSGCGIFPRSSWS